MQDIKEFEPLWGEWRSEKQLGQGSFGRVYKMVKSDLDKEYFAAVKHLSLPSEPDEEKNLFSEGLVTDHNTLKSYYDGVLRSLRSEIDLCYKLKGNTNIVSYEDHCIIPKSSAVGYDIFIKMELLTGLQDRIREGGLTVWDVVKLGEDICRALTVLRREKIIHRDIKPGNILINSGGDYKLGDFGVSRLIDRTMSGMSVKGTLSYMAPEIVKGSGGDYRVDIYSLGLVLYRMLNKNRAPFLPLPPQGTSYEENTLAMERRLRGDPLPSPADADEALPAIILKACAYRPEDRWESAEEMGKALEQYRLSWKQRETVLSTSAEQSLEPTELLPSAPHLPEEPTQWLGYAPDVDHDPFEEVFPSPPPAPVETSSSVSQKPEEAPLELTSMEHNVPPAPIHPAPQPTDDTMLLRQPAALRKEKQKQRKKKQPPQQKTQAEKPNTKQKQAKPEQERQKKTKPKIKKVGTALDASDASVKGKKPVIAVAGAAVLAGMIGIFALTGRSSTSELPNKVPPTPASTSGISIPMNVDEPEPVLWHDPFIRDNVLERLGVTEAELTLEKLAELEELCVPAPGPDPEGEAEPEEPASIATLADLAMLPGLRSLDLSGHPVVVFDLPEEMPSLKTLKLARCGCTDLEFFNRTVLENLRVLDLSGNEIADLSPLSGLAGLHELNITGTRTGSLEPLRGLAELAVLSAQGIPAEDWSPVEGVAQVEGRPEIAEEPEQSKPPEGPQNPPTGGNKSNSTAKPEITAVSSVSVSPSNIVLEVGDSVRLSASVSPSNAANQKVTWSSSNSSIATVDGSGYVSAVGRGTARITASCDGKSAVCTITVD